MKEQHGVRARQSGAGWDDQVIAFCLAALVTAVLTGICRPVMADFILPDTEANRKRGVVGCRQTNTGIDCSGKATSSPPSSSSSSSSSSSPSGSSSSSEDQAAKMQLLRQRQIEANDFRLRSIDRARSKLSYPTLDDDFFRSPSIDEQWQQRDAVRGQIGNLGKMLGDARNRISRILGDRPIDWDGSMRKPGTKPDFPAWSEAGKGPGLADRGNESLPVIGSGKPTIDAPAGPARKAPIDVPSPQLAEEAGESVWQKLIMGTYFGTGYGEEAAQWYADRYAAAGTWRDKAIYGAGGLFASLWTPDTYFDTANTLASAPGAAKLAEGLFAAAKSMSPWSAARQGEILFLDVERRQIVTQAGIDEIKVVTQVGAEEFKDRAEGYLMSRLGNSYKGSARRTLGNEFSLLFPDAPRPPGTPGALAFEEKLLAVAEKHGIQFDIMGKPAETAIGLERRANSLLREFLPPFRQEKWWWTGRDIDIRLSEATAEKLGFRNKIELARDIKAAVTGKRSGTSGLAVDFNYSKLYPEAADMRGLPAVGFRPGGSSYQPGWGAREFAPSLDNKALGYGMPGWLN